MKNKKKNKKKPRSICSSCGKSNVPVITAVNMSTGKAHFTCDACSAKESAKSIKDLAVLEKILAETQDMCSQAKEMASIPEEQPEVPKGLEFLVFTPLRVYESLQLTVDALKARRKKLLKKMDKKSRWAYKLQVAIEKENYQKAAKFRDKLAKLKA